MVKVISLSNEAYKTLKEMKTGNESFSDVVMRISKKKKDITKFFGIWRDNKEIGEIFENIEKDRKKFKLREVKF